MIERSFREGIKMYNKKRLKTKIQEFFYTMKVCGIRWFTWFLPFPVIIALMQSFGSQEKFNDEYVNAVRLGNSGLWFIYSQKIQDAIRKNCEKNRVFDEEIRRIKLKEDYSKEFNGENENE